MNSRGSDSNLTSWKFLKRKGGREVFLLEVQLRDQGINGNSEIFHHPLAPVGATDAFYLKCPYPSLRNVDEFLTTPSTSSVGDVVYFPLRYIRFSVEEKHGDSFNIITGVNCQVRGERKVSMNYKVKNRKSTKYDNEGVINDEEEAQGFQPLEDALRGLRETNAKFGANSGIPFRNQAGRLFWAEVKGIKGQNYYIDLWSRIFGAASKTGGISGSSSRYARYDDRNLSRPLVVTMQSATRNRFDGSAYGSGQELMRKLVGAINEIYMNPKKGIDPRSAQIEFEADMTPEPDFERDYCLLSENPFGLFQTYIHKEEVNSYMTELGKGLKRSNEEEISGVTPIRNKPGDSFPADMLRYLKELDRGPSGADRSDDKEGDMKPAQTEPTNDNIPTSSTSKVEASGLQEETTSASSSKSRKIKSRVEKHWEQNPGPNSWRELPGAYRSRNISLSSRKILRAAGTREGKRSQQQIMGFSAAHFAENVLRWSPPDNGDINSNERRMPNGLYIAEWLHICAYSWGGLLDEDTFAYSDNQDSSQTVDNLVFGTSETNSCMTRYESSWQTLFRDEAEMAEIKSRKNKNINITGFLQVQRNGEKCGYGYDKIDEQCKYSFEKDNIDESHSFNPGSPLITAAQHAKLLAYTISYEPSIVSRQPDSALNQGLGRTSLILDRPDTVRQGVEFYPFSRRFFHRAEHLLDSALYLAMYILAVKQHCGEKATDMIKERLKVTEESIKRVLKVDTQNTTSTHQKPKEEYKIDFNCAATELIGKLALAMFDLGTADVDPPDVNHE